MARKTHTSPQQHCQFQCIHIDWHSEECRIDKAMSVWGASFYSLITMIISLVLEKMNRAEILRPSNASSNINARSPTAFKCKLYWYRLYRLWQRYIMIV